MRRRRRYYETQVWPDGQWQVHLLHRGSARLVEQGCAAYDLEGSRLRAAEQAAHEAIERDRIYGEPGPTTRRTFKEPA